MSFAVDEGATPGQERFWRRLYDSLVLGFGLFCVVLVLIAPADRHLVPYRVIMCLLPAAVLLAADLLLRRFPDSGFLWFARYATPLFFFAFYFRLTGQIDPFFPLGHFDELIIKLDGMLFGDPRLSMNFQTMRFFAHPLFGEVMCFAYVAYFLFMPVFGGILIIGSLRGKPGPSTRCAWYVACVVVTYYLHYFVFFLFPVQGPAFTFATGIARDPGYVISWFHHLVVSRGDVPGGCFPSSHVAIAFLHALIARRLHWRKLYVISSVITVGICFSIVYTRTHYAADAVAGLISAAGCWLLLKQIERLANRPAFE